MELTIKQKQALRLLSDYETSYLGYGGAAGGGKSVLGCLWLMQFGHFLDGAKFFIGRDSIKDTRASVLKTWSEVAKLVDFTDYKFNDVGIVFGNGSEIELLDLTFYPYKDPLFDRLGSKEYTAGWIEEAQQTHPLAFEVLKTRVGRWKNTAEIPPKILATFNPKKNWIDTTFYRPYLKGNEFTGHKFIFALPTDNKFLPTEYIERLKNLKDEATKQRLLYGNFDYDDDPTALIGYDQILEMLSREAQKGLKVITADIARFGSDKAVIMVWNGFDIIEVVSYAISSTTDLQNAIRGLATKHGVIRHNIIVDEDGVGGGVVDSLKCTGFVNNSASENKQYSNLKTECGYMLAELFDTISMSANVNEETKEAIITELGQLKTFDADKDGKLKLLPKEKIKENIGRSPDYLDNFIMRMHTEVKHKPRGIKKAQLC